MNVYIRISLYSAASWADDAIWVRFLEMTQDATGLLPRKMGHYEPLRMTFPSVEVAAKQFAFEPSVGNRTWLLNYGHRIHADFTHYSSEEYHVGGRLNNEIKISVPLTWYRKLGLERTIKRWFVGLVENAHAFYGDVDLNTTNRQERQLYQPRWNLNFEFPTLGWLTYFSNGVISYFGKEKVSRLSPYAEQLKDGVLLTMGDTPEEAAARREEKFRLERILGADSFVVPVVLPRIDESTVDIWQLSKTDPFYHLPKMPNGERKPEFTYVPTFQALAKEFARPGAAQPPAEPASHADSADGAKEPAP